MNDHEPSSSTAGSAAGCPPQKIVPIDDSPTSTDATAAPCPFESSHYDSQGPSDTENFAGSVSEKISPHCPPSPSTNPEEAVSHLQKIYS